MRLTEEEKLCARMVIWRTSEVQNRAWLLSPEFVKIIWSGDLLRCVLTATLIFQICVPAEAPVITRPRQSLFLFLWSSWGERENRNGAQQLYAHQQVGSLNWAIKYQVLWPSWRRDDNLLSIHPNEPQHHPIQKAEDALF